MKLALKNLIAAAAFIGVGTASAAPITMPVKGEATFTYSQTTAGAWWLGKLDVGAFGGGRTSGRGKQTVVEPVRMFDDPSNSTPSVFSYKTHYNTWQSVVPIDALTYDPQGGRKMNTIHSVGGISLKMPASEEVLEVAGGAADLSALRSSSKKAAMRTFSAASLA